jgi:hypothetical protein
MDWDPFFHSCTNGFMAVGGVFRLELLTLPHPPRKAGAWTVHQVGAPAIRRCVRGQAALLGAAGGSCNVWAEAYCTCSRSIAMMVKMPAGQLTHHTPPLRRAPAPPPCRLQVTPQWGQVSRLAYPLAGGGEPEEVPPLGLRVALQREPRLAEHEVLRVGWWDEQAGFWRTDGIRWGRAITMLAVSAQQAKSAAGRPPAF